MSASYRYEECTLESIPSRVTFDVPRQNQGQIIEVAYGFFGHGSASPGDPYKRVTDGSNGSVTYYRRVAAQSTPEAANGS